ncbi:MAG: hypothetical protein WBC97_11840 [Gemmatimonadales bacterium]
MTDEIVAGLEALLTQFDALLGAGYSAVLYGAAARGEPVRDRSEVHVLLILEQATPAQLRALGPGFTAWGRAGFHAPLLLTRREWAHSGDAFPVEITDIKAAHRVLRGKDPVAEVTVAPGDLRAALERDLASGLMRFRQAWAMHASEPAKLGEVARGAAGPMVALCRGVLALAGRPVPASADAVVREAAQVIGSAADALAAVVAAERRKGWKCPPETFEGFLAAVDAAARYVDGFPTGDR